jgi:pimeloyl-ACP methyl ester carboxylesterase
MSFRFYSILKKITSCEPIHIVFFPGTGCNGSIFQKVAQQFLAQEVIFHYEHASKGGTLSEISTHCAENLLKSIGKERAIAVGHSLGGINAAMTVDAAPEIFQGLVLCNTRYRQVNPLERQTKNAIIKKISRCTEEQFDRLLCRHFFQNQEKLLTDEELNLLISCARSTGMKNFIQQINLSLEQTSINYQRILDRLPITVIQGMDDTVMPDSGWKESGLQDLTTKYPFELIECSGGHLSILKHPELIASKIEYIITAVNSPHNSSLSFRSY